MNVFVQVGWRARPRSFCKGLCTTTTRNCAASMIAASVPSLKVSVTSNSSTWTRAWRSFVPAGCTYGCLGRRSILDWRAAWSAKRRLERALARKAVRNAFQVFRRRMARAAGKGARTVRASGVVRLPTTMFRCLFFLAACLDFQSCRLRCVRGYRPRRQHLRCSPIFGILAAPGGKHLGTIGTIISTC